MNPDALSLVAAHLACAAFELPFAAGEPFGRVNDVSALLQTLSDEGLLHRSNGHYTWIGETYPAPVVDHGEARSRALAAYEVVKLAR